MSVPQGGKAAAASSGAVWVMRNHTRETVTLSFKGGLEYHIKGGGGYIVLSAEELERQGVPLEIDADAEYGGALLYDKKRFSYKAYAKDGQTLAVTSWEGIVVFWIDTAAQEKKEQAEKEDAARRLNAATAAVGTHFSAPWFVAAAGFSLAPLGKLPNLFAQIGADAGFVSRVAGVDYFSIYPFVHAGWYSPFSDYALKLDGGWFAGAGAGYMFQTWTFDSGEVYKDTFAIEAFAGVLLYNCLNLSYTLRTNFASINHKVSIGYTYRFK